MPEKFKNRLISGKTLNTLISSAVVAFFVCVILSYHNTLYNEKKSNIIFSGQMAAVQTADHLEQYFSKNSDVLQLTAHTLEDMLEENRPQREILHFLEKQTKAVSKTVFNNSKGIYGYINGEFLDGTGWIPSPDYEAANRPWYVNAIENKDNINIVDPYVDTQTGKVVMTISKELGDGKSVVAMDLLLDRVQEITEQAAAASKSDFEIIIDSRDLVVADSDPNEIGKNYGTDTDTLGAAILEKAKKTSGGHFEIEYAGEEYIVYVAKSANNWHCLSVKNASNVFRPLHILLWLTIGILIVVVLLLSYIMKKAYQQYIVARELNKQLSSISNIYAAMYEIDLSKDRFHVIKPAKNHIFKRYKDTSASTILEAMAREVSDKSSLVDIIRFITPKTLAERLMNVETIATEFLTVSHKWIRLRFIVSYRNADGTPVRLLLLAEDIDQEKSEREALVNVSEQAIAANEAKSQFLSNMSHEIRTPINAVLGMNEMILRECTDNYILTYAENIKAAGSTLLGLINNVLDYSKLESGKIEITPVKYELAALVDALVTTVKPQARSKGLTITVDIDEQAPKELFGDESRIMQVIENILSNAVKYTEKGNVILSVGFQEIDGAPNSVMLLVEVKDSGIGIKSEDMEKLFQKFARLDEKRNRSIEGTGLGLPIAQNLLYLMGSFLQVDSIYGLGSRFYFRLKQQVIKW